MNASAFPTSNAKALGAPGPAWVYLVDDDAVVRDALSFLLGSRGLPVLAFDGAASLLAHLAQAPRPVRGVFLLDVRMEPTSGLQLHESLIGLGLPNPVLFLSGHGDIPMVVEALKKGAFDFLEKPYSDNTLVDRLEQAMAVEAASVADNAAALERQARLASLSEREREVKGERQGRVQAVQVLHGGAPCGWSPRGRGEGPGSWTRGRRPRHGTPAPWTDRYRAGGWGRRVLPGTA